MKKTKNKGGASKSKSSTKKKTSGKKPEAMDNSLHALMLVKMSALYDVERQLIKAIPKMAKKATDKDLKMGLEEHLKETEEQAKRLEKAFEQLGEKPNKKITSAAIRGLAEDADWVMKNVKKPEALDANIIAAAQYVEYYEMAGYGTAISWAKLMGHDEVVALLEKSLEEEKMADTKLNTLAKSKVNAMALDA
jgi:ferritin-like metal-binding protein YciE